ncbi:MAG: insulinase family protein [Deltaproteobacteria bacterium]|nr:insulinase family protein [Deltaproteobacteria bacterium]
MASSAVPQGWAAEAAADPEAWRATAPVPGPAKAVATPKPQVFRAGPVEVVLVERHELPTVSMELVLAGGSAWDPPGREGQASACMQLLGSGTAKLDKVQFAEAQADLAASIDAWSGVDQQGLQLAVLSRNLAPALDLLADSLLRPGLRADELARIVARRKASLMQARGNPAAVAQRVVGPVAFGPQAWGRLSTEASLAALDVAGCQQHAAALSPEGARLYVVGDVTRAALAKAWQARFAEWKTPAAQLAPIGAPQPPAGRVFTVDVPGAEQTVVQVLGQGPERSAADYEATQLMMGVLGSGFSSRINMNLREKHGWAYGAGGGYQYRRGGSLLSLSASVRADASGPSVREMLSEIATLRAAPATADELAREKEGSILSLPARWSTGRSIASTFQGLAYYGLPLDWYDGHVARLQAVDLGAVQKAAAAHLDYDHLVVLIVGDLKAIGPQVQALLAEGPLKGQTAQALDSDGKPVAAAK